MQITRDLSGLVRKTVRTARVRRSADSCHRQFVGAISLSPPLSAKIGLIEERRVTHGFFPSLFLSLGRGDKLRIVASRKWTL